MGKFGWLLSKERILDEKKKVDEGKRVCGSKKKRRGERALFVAST